MAKKNENEKPIIQTSAEEEPVTEDDLFDVYDDEAINNNNSQEESTMNENVNNNTQAQENVQAQQAAAPVKEKKHMPVWLKYTIAGVIGIGAGIGGTLAVQHFTGDSAESLANNLFD